MNIIKRFISRVLKVVIVLLVFLSVNVTTTKAQTTYSDDNIFYGIGSFINSAQKGIAKKVNESEIIQLGRNYANSLIDNGSRLTDIVKVRGNEILFNPHGKSGINNAIDSAYGAYNDFANYAVSRIESDRYIVNINKTYEPGYKQGVNEKIGFLVVWGNPNDRLNRIELDYHTINPERIKDYYNISVDIDGVLGSSKSIRGVRRHSGSNSDSYYITEMAYDGVHNYSPGSREFRYLYGYGLSPDKEPVHVYRIVFHNDTYEEDDDIVPYNINNIPDEEEFVLNITNNFEPGKFYSYNFDEILHESTVINHHYITNNYVTIEDYEDDYVDDDTGSVITKDYTTLLDRILTAIKRLPQQIADLMPASVNEAGTNIWDLLTSIVDTIGNIGTSIIDGILDNLLGLIEAILNIIFPTQEQLEESKGHLDSLIITVQEKTDFITAPIQSFSSVYKSSGVAMFSSRDVSSTNNSTNLYNRTITINDTEVHILPSSLEPAISAFRMVSTGVVVILTIISIYTRFRGVVKH